MKLSDEQPQCIRYEVTDHPAQADLAAIDDALEAFNKAAAELDKVCHLACFARLPDGIIIGGAVARTWGECCELRQVWVDEKHRRHGVGRQLAQRVEAEARVRGCRLIYLETFSFQAPEFYRRLGFESVCEFHGFPDGIIKYIMRKTSEVRLTARPSPQPSPPMGYLFSVREDS